MLTPLLFGNKSYAKTLLGIRPSNLVGIWPFSDLSGHTCENLLSTEVTGNIIANEGFEVADDTLTFGAWQERVGTGAIASDAVIIHGGAASAKLTRGADDNTWIYEYLRVEPGETYSISFWSYANGGNPTRYGIKDDSNGTWIKALGTSTANSAAAWAEYTTTFEAPAGCSIIILYLMTPTGAGELCYWDDVSISGLQTLNASYAPSGVTLGEPGIGDGSTSAALTSANLLLGSPTFADNIDTGEGSAIAWGKVDGAARWTDGSEFRYLFHPKVSDSDHKYIVFGKNDQNHELVWRRKAGAGLDNNEQTYTFPVTGTEDWFCMGFSWSISTPRLKGYLHVPGEVAWHEVFSIAGANMDSFGDSKMDALYCTLGGGGYMDAQDWIGWMAYAALWGGAMLSDGEMRKAMRA